MIEAGWDFTHRVNDLLPCAEGFEAVLEAHAAKSQAGNRSPQWGVNQEAWEDDR